MQGEIIQIFIQISPILTFDAARFLGDILFPFLCFSLINSSAFFHIRELDNPRGLGRLESPTIIAVSMI